MTAVRPMRPVERAFGGFTASSQPEKRERLLRTSQQLSQTALGPKSVSRNQFGRITAR